jgi:cytochrome c2
MEKRTDSPYPRRDRPLLAIAGVALLIATGLFFWRDRQRDWRYYQWEFENVVRQKFGAQKAATVPEGLQQMWVAELRRADRCVTCHQGITWKGMETADHPHRTHPAAILASHPIDRYGCTLCHGGQGYSVDPDEAHGPMPHWEEPVLGSFLGEGYSLVGNKSALMQMQCNLCHRFDRQTKGAETINLAKNIVRAKGCRACHVINGMGGSIGPDLTYVGDKQPEQYDYSRLSGQKTVLAWHVAHFKDPKALVAETVMPNFGFTTEQAQALATLAMSWREVDFPASYRPDLTRADVQTPEEIAADERMRTGPGAWFVRTGCFVCHSVSSLGVHSPAQIGPDLSIAVEDVQSRFGRTVDDFLDSPTGTMAVVLSRQIILSPAEKAVAVQKLREAYAEHQKQQAAAEGGV